MTFIDSHSHLYLEDFSNDLPQVIDRAKSAGVSHVLLSNIDSTTIGDLLRVCNEYPDYCFPMMGLHPTSVKENYEEELRIVREHLLQPNHYIAVGEIGIDLYWDKTFLDQQKEALDRQLQMALEFALPVVIHTRDAFDEVCEVLEKYKKTPLKGVFHSFTGTFQDASKLLEFENFMLGINGVVTFKNSSLSEELKQIPLDRLLIETDAPYLTPVPYRGRRNESAYLQYTLSKLSDVYRLAPHEVAEITTRNTLKVFEMLK